MKMVILMLVGIIGVTITWGVGMYSIRSLGTSIDTIYSDSLLQTNRLNDMKANDQMSVRLLMAMIIDKNDEKTASVKESIDSLTVQNNELFDKYMAGGKSTEAEKISEEFQPKREAFLEYKQEIIRIAETGDYDASYAYIMQNWDVMTSYDELRDELLAVNLENSEGIYNQSITLDRNAMWVLAGTLLAVIILLVTLNKIIQRSIMVPMGELSENLLEISEGNLDVVLETEDEHEVGQIYKNFNTMITNTRRMVGVAQQTSKEVANISEVLVGKNEELSTSMEMVSGLSSDLTSKVEAQSSSLHESSIAMNEMAIGIQNIVESSATVSVKTTETTKQVEVGNIVMDETIHQMETIKDVVDTTNNVIEGLIERTMTINKSLDVINEIADQTNLLALNASIEAARAGDHGKGFAVVAEEVRKLADQSRNSVNDITNLLEQMTKDTEQVTEATEKGKQEVDNGMAKVQQVKETFEEIHDSIKTVTDEIITVSSTTEEMSAGIEEVNASIADIRSTSEVVVENANQSSDSVSIQHGEVEASTALAHSLQELSNELAEVISVFKLTEVKEV